MKERVIYEDNNFENWLSVAEFIEELKRKGKESSSQKRLKDLVRSWAKFMDIRYELSKKNRGIICLRAVANKWLIHRVFTDTYPDLVLPSALPVFPFVPAVAYLKKRTGAKNIQLSSGIFEEIKQKYGIKIYKKNSLRFIHKREAEIFFNAIKEIAKRRGYPSYLGIPKTQDNEEKKITAKSKVNKKITFWKRDDRSWMVLPEFRASELKYNEVLELIGLLTVTSFILFQRHLNAQKGERND